MVGSYIDRMPMVELLSNNEFIQKAKEAKTRNFFKNVDMNDNFIRVASDIGFILEHSNKQQTDINYYEVNQYHEIYKLLEAPHSDKILKNKVALGILGVLIHKKYMQFVPVQHIKDATGFKESEIRSELNTLKKLNMVRKSMIIKGSKDKMNIIENANEVISQLNSLKELFNNDETVETAEITAILGDLDTPDENSENVICQSESEYIETMKYCIQNNEILHPESKNSVAKLDDEDNGFVIIEDNKIISNLVSVDMKLNDNIDVINKHYYSG